MSSAPAMSPPKAVRILIMIGILALIVALVVLFYVPFISEYSAARTVSLVVLALIGIVTYRAYERDFYKSHPKQQKAVIMFTSAAFTAFAGMITLSLILGSPKPYLPYLWIAIILLAFIGAFIGDLITKKIQKQTQT